MPKLKSVICAGAVIFRINCGIPEFLLINPRKGDGKEWGFPKGHAEEGESVEETAVREVYEETGIVPKLLYELPPVFTKNPNEHKTVHFWLSTQANPVAPQMQKEEVREIRWFKVTNLPRIHDYQISVIRSAISALKRNMC